MRLFVLAVVAAVAALLSGTVSAASLANRTQISFAPGHGTQIEYLAADGSTYLWYPGNRIILPGAWKTEGASICFRYGKNTYNPVTRHSGGNWECEPLKAYNQSIVDSSKGDIFGLAGRKSVPFDLPRGGLPKNQILAILYPEPAPKVDVQAHCKSVLANAGKSKDAKRDAALLYYHGMWMGERCVPVDYARALKMLKEIGDAKLLATLVKDLESKASGGNPKAIAALNKVDH